ncbi:MAG: nucleotide exchange factor GrpE [Epsilonproteobacteria bacterium]|nr:nucleotide exchange factor GrpE [Campylobacterota bacterium]
MDKDSKDSIDVEIETAEPIKSVDDSVNEENPQLSEIEKLKAEVASWEDKFLRTHAHFENSKKLLEKDKDLAVAYANESFAKDMLAVIDSLDSALGMIKGINSGTDKSEFVKKMEEGLVLVDEQLHKILEKHHIKPIDCSGDFDPNLHQAVMQEESPEHQSGEIVKVLQKGYTMKDRVLRPAMVSTAR